MSMKAIKALILICILLVSTTYSYAGETQGGFSYKIEDSEVTITGYTGNQKDLIIPSTIEGFPVTDFTVLSIDDSIDSLELPASLVYIDLSRLASFKGLKAIYVDKSNSVYSDDNGVLYNKIKTELLFYPQAKVNRSFKIPDTVRKVNQYAFSYVQYLNTLYIPASVTSIAAEELNGSFVSFDVSPNNPAYSSDHGVLYNKEKQALLKYPQGKKDKAFTVPSGIKVLSQTSFGGNQYLTSVIIPDSVTDIGRWAFISCSNLESVKLSQNLKTIPQSAFYWCIGLKEITIPDSVTEIEDAAFWCTGLESINIPQNVKTIGSYAFSTSYHLKYVTIAGEEVEIGYGAFSDCDDALVISVNGDINLNLDIVSDARVVRSNISKDSEGKTGYKYLINTKYLWAKSAIYDLYAKGIILGDLDTSFNPGENITKGELLSYLARLSPAELTVGFNKSVVDQWGEAYLNWGRTRGIISGDLDGTLGSDDFVTRQDLAVIIYNYMNRAMKYGFKSDNGEFDLTDSNQAAKHTQAAVESLCDAGILNRNPDGTFDGKTCASKAATAVILSRMAEYMKSSTERIDQEIQREDEANKALYSARYGTPLADEEYIINGLSVNSTKSDAEKSSFGKPVEVFSNGAFSVYSYDNNINLNITFFENSTSSSINSIFLSSGIHIDAGRQFCGPRGIRIGDDIGEAIKKLGITEELKAMNIRSSDPVDAIDKKLYEAVGSSYGAIVYQANTVQLSIYYGDARITQIEIQRILHNNDPTDLQPRTSQVSKFSSAEVLKPEEIKFCGQSIDFEKGAIALLGNPDWSTYNIYYYEAYENLHFDNSMACYEIADIDNLNSNRLSDFATSDSSLVGPRGIKIGDKIKDVIKRFPNDENCDFSLTETSTVIYGEEDYEKGSAVVYYGQTKDSGSIEFYLSSGYVFYVEYKALTVVKMGIYYPSGD